MEKIVIGMVAPAFVYFPVWIAEEQRLFKKHGLEAAVEVYGSTEKVTTSLESNACQIGMVTPEGVVANATMGGTLRLVAGNANRAPLSLIGQKGIRRIADLKGKRIGTSSLQEGTAIMIQKMLAKHDLQYPRDYEFSLVGAHPQRWEHLQKGTIDAGLQLMPLNYVAEEAGYPNLGEASEYVPHYAFTAVAVNLAWANPHRDVAVRALSALTEAVEWAFTHPDEAARILSAATRSSEKHAKRAMMQLINDGVTPSDMKIETKALEVVFDVMREANLVEKGVTLTYALCVDDSFMVDVRG